VRTLNRDEVMKVWTLSSCENFVGKVSERSLYSMRSVILSQWRVSDGSDMTVLKSFNDSTSKRVLDLLKTGYLRLREFIVERITVTKFGVNDSSSNGTGS